MAPSTRLSNHAPACTAAGRHCRHLDVVLRVSSLEDGPLAADHEATWLLGHTQRITFRELWADDGELYTDATLHVPCKFLRSDGTTDRCLAHGFRQRAPAPGRTPPQPRQLGADRFCIIERHRQVDRRLPAPAVTPRSLPVMAGENPCAVARCTTSDHKVGAACCRDLQVEIMCTRRQKRLESLVRSRQSPYLCKISRDGDYSLEVEMISACGYLDPADGIACTLHGRVRADGRPAKPDLCSDWPPTGQTLHPGCVFARPRRKPKKVHPPSHDVVHGIHEPPDHPPALA